MKKLLLLIIIVITILSVTKVEAQTLNWAKGHKWRDIDNNASWFKVSADKKYFYVSSVETYAEYIGIYALETGNLVRKFQAVGWNHYLIDDSTFMYIDYFENDSINPYQMVYDNVNIDHYSKEKKFSKPLTFNGKKYIIDYNDYEDYRDFITDKYLIFTAESDDDGYSFVFWDIKNRCISDVIKSSEHTCRYNILSFTYDQARNMLYYSDGDRIFQFDVTSRKILKKMEIISATHISISNDAKYISLYYYDIKNWSVYVAVISTVTWKIVWKSLLWDSYLENPNVQDIPVAFSPNSTMLAFPNAKGELETYNLVTKISHSYKMQYWPDYIQFLNDNQLLISSENFGITAVFDLIKKKMVKSLIVNESLMRQIEYSHNGEKIAILSYNCLKVLDAKTGNLINFFFLNGGDKLTTDFCSIDFSKDDDKIIFSCNYPVYFIYNLTSNKYNFFETDSKVITACYSANDNNIIAFGTEKGEVTVAYDNGTEIIKKANSKAYKVRSVMFSDYTDALYYILFDQKEFIAQPFSWDYKTDNLTELKNLQFPYRDYWCYTETFHNRFFVSHRVALDTKNLVLLEVDSTSIPVDNNYTLTSISKDGKFSTFIQFNWKYSDSKIYCNLSSNDNGLCGNQISAIIPTDYLPYNGSVIESRNNGNPVIHAFSPDNKNLILGLDCGSIISLNIENLTPVKEDFVTVEGFRIVKVMNKGTFLNCEIYSPDNLSDYDYYIYDLTGKLLNQGALGTIGQGTNNIIINYTKTTLYPAILMIKSKTDNSYQSKLFY